MKVEDKKETPVKCPDWCREPEGHGNDRPMRFHYGAQVWVYPGTHPDEAYTGNAVRVRPVMETAWGKDDPPAVTFTASAEDASSVDISPKGARVIASVIEILSSATPEQHKEYVAGIRAAAAAIEPEAEAG